MLLQKETLMQKLLRLRIILDMNLKFCTIVAKGLKLKVGKLCSLVPNFLEVTGEKLVGGPFCPPPHPE